MCEADNEKLLRGNDIDSEGNSKKNVCLIEIVINVKDFIEASKKSGTTAMRIWGTDIYTHDSDVGKRIPEINSDLSH